MNPTWFETFFFGVANDLWRQCVAPEQTRAEASFILRNLGCDPPARVLDVACGNGRHSLELAKRGCRLTGLDLSLEFIEEARRNAQAAGLSVDCVHGDVRHLNWEAEFDGAYCFGNSFGYLTHADTLNFLIRLGRALKPNARFILETGGAAESLLPHLKQREWFEIGDILFLENHQYQADTSCLETRYTFVRQGKVETRTGWQYVYTTAEIRRLLDQAGLNTVATYGSLEEKPYQLGDQCLLLVSQRRV